MYTFVLFYPKFSNGLETFAFTNVVDPKHDEWKCSLIYYPWMLGYEEFRVLKHPKVSSDRLTSKVTSSVIILMNKL